MRSFTPPFRLFIVALLLFTVVMFCMTRAVYAADVTLTWTNPTLNEDGSIIPVTGPGSLTSNRVEWGSCVSGAFGTKAGEKIVTPAATTTVVTGLAPATHCFRVYARNTYAAESGASNVAVKLVPPPVPQPPVLTAATIVHDLTRFGSIGRLVGSIALGVQCEGEPLKTWANGTTWYAVPADAVTLTRKPRSSTLVAKCA